MDRPVPVAINPSVSKRHRRVFEYLGMLFRHESGDMITVVEPVGYRLLMLC